MKCLALIFLFIFSFVGNALSQSTDEEIENTQEQPKWEIECNKLTCTFKRDIIHNKAEEEALITVFVSISNNSQEIERMAIFYPGSARPENGGVFAFMSSTIINDEYKLKPEEGSAVRIPFVTCVEDGCITEVIPNSQIDINYSILIKMMSNSHMLFLYTHDDIAITATAELSSFQQLFGDEYLQMIK